MKPLAEWFWTDRWDGSSAALLPLEARGLYREMLTQAWRRGARLPSNVEAIKRAVRCTDEEWARCWPLVKPYWVERDGWLTNETQVEVWEETRKQMEARSSRGAAAARKRWQCSSNARALPEHMLGQSSGNALRSPDLDLSPDQAPGGRDKKIPSESLSEPSASDVKKPRRVRILPSVEAVRLSEGLLGSIRAHTPRFRGPASLDGWARAVDLMIRVDGRAPGEIEDVIRWAHGSPEGSFWRGNILSGDTLRRQFDRLVVQMKERGRGGRASPSDILRMAADMEAAERNGSVS